MYTYSWMIWKWKAGDIWKLTLAFPTCASLWATFPSPRARPRSWKNSVKLQVTQEPKSLNLYILPQSLQHNYFFVFFNFPLLQQANLFEKIYTTFSDSTLSFFRIFSFRSIVRGPIFSLGRPLILSLLSMNTRYYSLSTFRRSNQTDSSIIDCCLWISAYFPACAVEWHERFTVQHDDWCIPPISAIDSLSS